MKKRFICIFGILAIVLLIFTTTHADILDPYDNIVAPPGTFALGTYLMYQHYPEYSPKDFDDIDIGVDASILALRPIYFAPVQFFGHSWGFNAILPMGQVSVKDTESTTGFGDLIFGPFIYLIENETDNIYLSFWEFIQAPTGKFSDELENNIGTDRWFFEQELAFGWYPGKFGIDANLNWWIFNESSAHNIKPPMAIEFEAVFHYAVTEKFTVGLQGAAWWDLGDTEVDGMNIDGSKGDNIKVGLNFGYNLLENLIVNLRFMQDVRSENWTKGSWTYLRLLYIF